MAFNAVSADEHRGSASGRVHVPLRTGCLQDVANAMGFLSLPVPSFIAMGDPLLALGITEGTQVLFAESMADWNDDKLREMAVLRAAEAHAMGHMLGGSTATA